MPVKATGKANAKAKSKSNKEDDEPYVASKSAKMKKEKDPNAPKRPMSSYFLFLNERRETLKQEKPDLKMGEQTKVMTAEWKSMDAKKKKKYEDLASKDKQRYETEMRAHDKGYKPAAQKKEEKDNAPKKVQNPYLIFSAEMREKLKKDQPNLGNKQVMSKIAEEWKKLDAKKKEKYEKIV